MAAISLTNNLGSWITPTYKQAKLFPETGYFDFRFKIKSKDFVQLDLLNQICKAVHRDAKLQLKGWDNQDDYMSINAGLTLEDPDASKEIYVMFSNYVRIIFGSEMSDWRYTII